MDIRFASNRLQKQFESAGKLARKHGQTRAGLITQRVYELRSLDALDDVRMFPAAQCEELKGNRKGQLSVRLDGGWRLVFEPGEKPAPKARWRAGLEGGYLRNHIVDR